MFAVQDIGTAIARQLQVLQRINLYPWMPILVVLILVITGILVSKVYRRFPGWFSRGAAALKAVLAVISGRKRIRDETLYKTIAAAGYSYDSKQDIFYSNMFAWQRKMGYCSLYDEACAPLGMIIDCEPICFSYEGKRWLIEFWKGQYDMCTGCEIGIYITEKPDLNIIGVFKGPFYYSAREGDQLEMSFCLKKNGSILFTREDTHWWLTGFKLGEFSEPSELTMDIKIVLKDEIMRNAFVQGLKNAGYSEDQLIINENVVEFIFNKPHTPQPSTRTKETDKIIQRKNEILCDKYQEITGPYNSFPDKINAIQQQAPELYKSIINIGKTKELFKNYKKIKSYLK